MGSFAPTFPLTFSRNPDKFEHPYGGTRIQTPPKKGGVPSAPELGSTIATFGRYGPGGVG